MSLGTYALIAPFWGMLCDKQFGGTIVQLLGAVFIVGGFTLIGKYYDCQHKNKKCRLSLLRKYNNFHSWDFTGPAPFIPIEP